MRLVSFSQATFKQTDILKSYKEAEELINLGKYAVAQPFLQDFLQKYETKHWISPILFMQMPFIWKPCVRKKQLLRKRRKIYNTLRIISKGIQKRAECPFHLGDLAYAKSNYNDALAFFDKVDEKSLTGKDVTEFQYKRAFANFALKKFSQARMYFNQIAVNKKHPYNEEGYYYSGLSSYYLKDYNAVTKVFSNWNFPKNMAKSFLTTLHLLNS